MLKSSEATEENTLYTGMLIDLDGTEENDYKDPHITL
jgi:hypothetical protein